MGCMGQERTAGQIELDVAEMSRGSAAVAEIDQRPGIPEPPPVRLVAVKDVRLIAPAGAERQLDEFYVGLLELEREPDSHFPVYRAENLRIWFDIVEPPVGRGDMRPLGIEVSSLVEAEHKFIDAKIEYVLQKGVNPGDESLLLLDPAGNWIEISESRMIV